MAPDTLSPRAVNRAQAPMGEEGERLMGFLAPEARAGEIEVVPR